MPRLVKTAAKRGDTLIEVMFAITIFALVAVLSIAMMNAGIASGERSLELVTARNELNAQAEAIRFIHSSYIAEKSLPETCSEHDEGKCQQYKALWEAIVSGAKDPYDPGDPNSYSIPSPVEVCTDVYESDTVEHPGESLLVQNHAFVINTRDLNKSVGNTDAYISAKSNNVSAVADPFEDDKTDIIFRPALLNARLVYSNSSKDLEDGLNTNFSTTGNPLAYTTLAEADGIWVVAVKGKGTAGGSAGLNRAYYDFYIQTCWYGSNSNAPTSLDTIIRLYSPEDI